MFKKILCITLAMMMLASMMAIGANAATGVAGNYYYTDIQTYVRGELINSYNIGGKTVIVAEDLRSYGFSVVWDGVNRTLTITNTNGAAKSNASAAASGVVGDIAGNYYYSDIVTYYNATAIESYSLDGVTVIPATLLRDFGFEVIWDEAGRKVYVNDPSEFPNVKIKDNQTYKGNLSLVTEPVLFNGERLITKNNTYIIAGLSGKYYIPFKAIADELGITYTWNSETSTITLKVPADGDIKPAKTEMRTNSKTFGTIQYEVKDIVLNFVNGDKKYTDVDAVLYGDTIYVESGDLADAFGMFCVNNVELYTQTLMYYIYTGAFQQ